MRYNGRDKAAAWVKAERQERDSLVNSFMMYAEDAHGVGPFIHVMLG